VIDVMSCPKLVVAVVDIIVSGVNGYSYNDRGIRVNEVERLKEINGVYTRLQLHEYARARI